MAIFHDDLCVTFMAWVGYSLLLEVLQGWLPPSLGEIKLRQRHRAVSHRPDMATLSTSEPSLPEPASQKWGTCGLRPCAIKGLQKTKLWGSVWILWSISVRTQTTPKLSIFQRLSTTLKLYEEYWKTLKFETFKLRYMVLQKLTNFCHFQYNTEVDWFKRVNMVRHYKIT